MEGQIGEVQILLEELEIIPPPATGCEDGKRRAVVVLRPPPKKKVDYLDVSSSAATQRVPK